MSDQDIQFAPEVVDTGESEPPWRVLVVDDDAAVHVVTRLALEGARFAGRPIALLHARSAGEALALLATDSDYAVILLDVVMETDHAGLEVARAIREQFHNRLSQILLRTGQPGVAPEREVVEQYEINDYLPKAELTTPRLRTALYTALRNHSNLVELDLARRAAEEARTRLSDFSALASDWLFELGPDLHLSFISRAGTLKRLTRVVPAVIENRFRAVLGRSADFEALLADRRAFRGRRVRIDFSGRPHDFVLAGRPVFDHTGAFAGYRGGARDITRELRVGAMLQAALQAVPVGFAIIGHSGYFLERNHLFDAFAGLGESDAGELLRLDQVIQRQAARGDKIMSRLEGEASVHWILPGYRRLVDILGERERSADFERRQLEAWYASLRPAGGGPGQGSGAGSLRSTTPIEVIRGDTGQVIELRASPVRGLGWVVVLSDVTLRRRAERELVRVQEELVRKERLASLGQLAASIAHEIKNPLSFIKNFAKLGQEMGQELVAAAKAGDAEEAAALETDLVEALEKVVEHSMRADGVVRNMLTHARDGKLEPQTTDLKRLLADAIGLAVYAGRTQHGGVPVEVERQFPEGKVEALVLPQELMRVILNLLDNAWYAIAERAKEEVGFKGKLQVSLIPDVDQAEIRIRDNGCGMPEDVRARLFTPFFTTKPQGQGTGLGLSLSYDVIVNAHRGSFAVDSRPMEFTEFTITLPR